MNRKERKRTKSVNLVTMIDQASEVPTTMVSDDPRVLHEVLLVVELMKETPEVHHPKATAEALTPGRVMITEEAQAVVPPNPRPMIRPEVTGEDEHTFHHH